MAKDPAINWYFDNWLGGTKGMNRIQKACYFDILTAQYFIGHLTLEQIKNELGSDFHTWSLIKHKFKQDESGNYYNERMDTEILKRNEYSKQQSERVKKRWDKQNGIYHGNTTVIPINETETEIETFGKGTGKPLKTNPEKEEVERVFIQQGGTKEMALYFFNQYEAVNWKLKGSDINNFSTLVGNFIKNWNTPKQNGSDPKETQRKVYNFSQNGIPGRK